MKKSPKKFSELLLYIVAKFKEEKVAETKLMKLLYFTEANFYRINKKTITNIDFYKNHFGPTPDFKIFKKAVELLGPYLKREEKSIENGKIVLYSIKNTNYKYQNLTGEEMNEADKVFDMYSRLSSEELSRIAHFDPPYLAAKEMKDRIKFNFVIYRKDREEDKEISFSDEEQKEFANQIPKDVIEKLLDYAGRS